MTKLQSELIRTLVSAQVAVYEWGDADVNDDASANMALDTLDTLIKQAQKIAKEIRKEGRI